VRRRDFIGALALTAGLCRAAGAAGGKIPVVGFLGLTSRRTFEPVLAAFKRGLADTGFVEGRNVAIEYRWAEGREDRLAALAAELARRPVDVIATSGGLLVARAAKAASSTIPIVFEIGPDPIAAGLVESFAHPGGNMTGVVILTADLNPKRLDLLSKLVPGGTVYAALVNPENAVAGRVVGDLEKAAQARKIELHVLKAADESEFPAAFAAVSDLHAAALLVANDPVFFSRRERLVALAAQHGIPAVYEWREFVVAGGLMSYGTSLGAMERQKGAYVGKILAGARPADLPVVQPTRFELVINLKTARALGLAVPPLLLAQADEVIE
jgi:putative ABC transport system substrate-binding protein